MRTLASLATAFAAAVSVITAFAADAADDVPALTWQLNNVKDPMTDAVSTKAISQITFGDGVSLEAYAHCKRSGEVEFEFATFHGQAAAPFKQEKERTAMRMRFDGGKVELAIAIAEYTNKVKTVFLDVKRLSGPSRSSQPGATGLDRFMDEVGSMAWRQMLGVAGDPRQLAGARSILLELPLADGSSYVVELNPQDQVLKGIVQQCTAANHSGAETTETKAKQAAAIASARARMLVDGGRMRAIHPTQIKIVMANEWKTIPVNTCGYVNLLPRQSPTQPAPPTEIPSGYVKTTLQTTVHLTRTTEQNFISPVVLKPEDFVPDNYVECEGTKLTWRSSR